MRLSEYEAWADMRVAPAPPLFTSQMMSRVLLGAVGLAAEAAEVLDEIKKLVWYGKPWATQREKVKKELGDVLFYFVIFIKACGFTFDEIINENVRKLIERDGENMEKWGDRARENKETPHG